MQLTSEGFTPALSGPFTQIKEKSSPFNLLLYGFLKECSIEFKTSEF